ncbi:limbic system-associated membrane protein-like [Antedon mediterranea]|uniref:limbic system-associated membrane protein-like n=1 Tax=Antedon mediterranea TaxID=105859 RepID=UPI003AF418A4
MILHPTFLFIAFLLLNKTFSFPEFIKQPEDESRAEGELTYFNCMVKNLDEGEYVSWLHNGRKISRKDIISDTSIFDRYSIEFDDVFSTYNLRIKNIQRRDVGIYACAVYDDSDNVVAETKSSNFTVLQIPEKYYPLCSNIKTSYKLNQNIVVVCSSEKTYPLPSLIWKRDGINIVSQLEEKTSRDIYKVSYSVNAKQSDNRAIFICELTTSANPSIRRNCSVGPINVLYPPVVSIKQTSDIVLGDEAIFICYSDANPQENIFQWSFDPPINKNMYFLENEFILRITNVVISLNDTIVTCEVENSVGRSYSKLNINIKRKTSFDSSVNDNEGNGKGGSKKNTNGFKTEGTEDDGATIGNKEKSKNQNSNQNTIQTRSQDKKNSTDVSISLVITIAVVCIIVILGLALIPVGYMRYTRRQPSDTISRGRPVSIPDVYFEPRDHIDPMLPQLGLAAPWMRTVGVQVPGECEYDVTYNTQVMPQLRQVYYSQRMYPPSSL